MVWNGWIENGNEIKPTENAYMIVSPASSLADVDTEGEGLEVEVSWTVKGGRREI
jgi:hypothetical protein